jgi:AcrR family transcriptional regulator
MVTDDRKFNEHCSVNGVQFNLTFQFVNPKMLTMGIAERKNRQRQALRERILDAARRIVMREGFAALSMRKIAEAIEYSPATLYLHFASRDEIAQALCAEGYAQLLETFVPLAGIADPGERLKALGRAYVAFGVAHPETYRLIFMEDPSYTGAALGGGAAKAKVEAEAAVGPVGTSAAKANAAVGLAATGAASAGAGTRSAVTSVDTEATAADDASGETVATGDDPGEAALHIMISALEELKAAGRLSASTDVAVWAEAFWANLHGIVALNLTCPVFPGAPLDTVVEVALGAWLGPSHATQSQSATAIATRKKKSTDTRPESPTEPKLEPDPESAAEPSAKKSAKAAAGSGAAPAPRRKATRA